MYKNNPKFGYKINETYYFLSRHLNDNYCRLIKDIGECCIKCEKRYDNAVNNLIHIKYFICYDCEIKHYI